MGQPKMLLPWGDTTVIGQVVMIFSKADISDIIVVTGGDRDVVETELAKLANELPVRAVYNSSFENGGMMTSIQAGLGAIPFNCKAVLIGLGDQPQVEVKTLKDILAIYEKSGAEIIVPSCENRRGHPALISAKYISEFLKFDPQSSLRDFINAHQSEICYVEAAASVLHDLDTPQDYQDFTLHLKE